MIITYKLVILLIITFVIVGLFIKTIDKRKWLTLLLTIILTPVIYFYLFYPLLNIFSSYHHEKYFNSEQWMKKPGLRFEMTNEMIEEKLLDGKNKIEIKTLLGQPEWLGWDDALKINSDNKWNYNLGFKPGAFNDKQESIEIIFNKTLVKTIRLYQTERKFE